TKVAVKDRTKAIQPERKRLAKEREQRIADAQAKLDALNKTLPSRITKWAEEHKEDVEWFPLVPTKMTASTKAVFSVQPDRSVLVTGKAGKGQYDLEFRTNLTGITGFRIEALSDASLPSGGPGRSGNFVVTEILLQAGPENDASELRDQTIASAKADFLQKGFAIERTFDGNNGNQSAWAVSGAVGVDHWATFQLAKPIESTGPTLLKFRLHQRHNAANHQLGRFRISVTTATGKIPLGRAEPIAAALSSPPNQRDKAQNERIRKYVQTIDPELSAGRSALATAKKPLAPDADLVALQAKQKRLSVETADPPALVKLRVDAKQSQKQLGNRRLTAAEDLTWALVNSPAFLFNH
ncbi:MAG: hypothetical protein AAGA03_10795, partial [Planctomycetota bacterium]